MTLQPGLDGMVIPKLLGKWTLGQFDLRRHFVMSQSRLEKRPEAGWS